MASAAVEEPPEPAAGSASEPWDDDALDSELCALLDGSDGEPDGGGAATAPAAKPSRRTLLDAIRADGVGHLLAPVAVARAPLAPAANPLHDELTRRRRRDPASRAASERKRARIATGALESDRPARNTGHPAFFEFCDPLYARMNLRDVPWSQFVHNTRFEGVTILDISELPDDPMEAKSGRLGEFYVFGCLVRKHGKRRARDGRKYAVWTLSNMQTGSATDVARAQSGQNARSSRALRFTSINCLIFDSAFDAFHMQVEGAVFAFRKPAILPPQASKIATHGDALKESTQAAQTKAVPEQSKDRIDEWSGVAMKVAKKDDIVPVGVCKDFAYCGKHIRDRGDCGTWFNKKLGTMCAKHSKERLRSLTVTSRLDIGSQACPGASRADFASSTAPVNVTVAEAPENAQALAMYSAAAKAQTRENIKPVMPSAEERLKVKKLVSAQNPQCISGRPAGSTARSLADFERRSRSITGITRCRGLSHSSPARLRATCGASSTVRAKNVSEYRAAVKSLLRLGFRLDSAGCLFPPASAVLQRMGIELQTSRMVSTNVKPANDSFLPQHARNLRESKAQQTPTESSSRAAVLSKANACAQPLPGRSNSGRGSCSPIAASAFRDAKPLTVRHSKVSSGDLASFESHILSGQNSDRSDAALTAQISHAEPLLTGAIPALNGTADAVPMSDHDIVLSDDSDVN